MYTLYEPGARPDGMVMVPDITPWTGAEHEMAGPGAVPPRPPPVQLYWAAVTLRDEVDSTAVARLVPTHTDGAGTDVLAPPATPGMVPGSGVLPVPHQLVPPVTVTVCPAVPPAVELSVAVGLCGVFWPL